jgi:uncharacterized protein (DUF2147 family)
MKTNLLRVVLLLLSISFYGQNHSVIGKWKTVDENGVPKSIVEIHEKGNKIYGKVVEILIAENKNKLCTKCSGEDKNKPILGMTIIKGLIKDDAEYKDGEILDPNTGKLYQCFINLYGNDKLKVRGFMGFSFIGRTQYWYRVKN